MTPYGLPEMSLCIYTELSIAQRLILLYHHVSEYVMPKVCVFVKLCVSCLMRWVLLHCYSILVVAYHVRHKTVYISGQSHVLLDIIVYRATAN